MFFFKDLDWGNWFYGLLAGGIGGGATAVSGAFAASMIDSHFAVGTAKSFALMGVMFGMSFVKDAALYLKQNPLPHLKTVTTTVQTTAPIRPEGKVVTTVEETHTEEVRKP